MKCSWQTFLSPLKGQCPYYALIGLSQTTVLRVVLIVCPRGRSNTLANDTISLTFDIVKSNLMKIQSQNKKIA